MEKDNEPLINLAQSNNPVEITSEIMHTNPILNDMLRSIGKRLYPNAHYVGSFASHIYVTTDLLNIDRKIESINQQVGEHQGMGLVESASSQTVKLALTLLKDELMRSIDPSYSPRTLNKKDERGK